MNNRWPHASGNPMECCVKTLLSICLLPMFVALAGCAGVTTDVAATGALPAAATATYRFAPTPAQVDAGEILPYQALLSDGLAQRGFNAGAPEAARYLVSVAWDTHPADVKVVDSGCGADCVPAEGPSLPWFGRPYVHTLTLRFFALPDGGEVYKVSAVKRDRNADAREAVPYLVAGALARLPYAGAPHWRVKLQSPANAGTADRAPGMPEVLSVSPIDPQ
ncbi:DUF4136 domain-containing protein [Paraburkholderia sp. CNPSo 3274]|uniref:DUF4136 domain-containing protein n=1 Tax=Paraburkholderia sp. CNPSo 3274 TaxID=2940932 RepID=UPI0020B8B508|nr:DUF4136 domain-containing protein [Paraburkholderia sp. CNPSo 3274]MCP3705727.1 DUF4136 domain-containing protein [Paraburkholderia sp. CNPSo 3274]